MMRQTVDEEAQADLAAERLKARIYSPAGAARNLG